MSAITSELNNMGSSFISSQCFLRDLILSSDIVKAELLQSVSAGDLN